MPCPVKNLAGWAPRHFTTSSSNGVLTVCSPKFGSEVWPNTTNYKESLGLGKQQIVRASKHLWPENLVVQTRRIGGKKGSKRHVLVDEKGIPISLLVSAANQHDSVALEPLLKAAVVSPAAKTECHLCLDQGTLVKRKSPSAMVSSPTYAHEERKRRRSQPIPSSRRDDGSSNGHTPGSIAFESWSPGMKKPTAPTWPWPV